MRILVVEDEGLLRQHIAARLRDKGFAVEDSGDGAEGLYLATELPFDAAVVDLGLPGLSGLALIRRLREQGSTLPILILTARDRWQDKVEGLEIGADDYLTKPFDRGELLARIQAIVRRARGHSQPVVQVGRLSVNLGTRTAEIDEQPLHLTGKEYGILELLAMRRGSTLTKEQFLNHLYGGMDEPELKIIDVFICKLRKKIAKATGSETYVETVWGRGYRLCEPAEAAAKTA